jgi:hypothetical protein
MREAVVPCSMPKLFVVLDARVRLRIENVEDDGSCGSPKADSGVCGLSNRYVLNLDKQHGLREERRTDTTSHKPSFRGLVSCAWIYNSKTI